MVQTDTATSDAAESVRHRDDMAICHQAMRAAYDELDQVDFNPPALLHFLSKVQGVQIAAWQLRATGLAELTGMIEELVGVALQDDEPPDADWLATLRRYIDETERLLSKDYGIVLAPSAANMSPRVETTAVNDQRTQTSELLVYLMDKAKDQADALRQRLQADELRVKLFDSLEALREAVVQRPPSVLIAAIDEGPDEASVLESIGVLKQSGRWRFPVFFMATAADPAQRLRALRAGGDAFFVKPLNMPALVARIRSLESAESATIKVLIVDDSRVDAGYHAALLRREKIQVREVHKPLDAVTEMFDFRPDLVLLDLHMPEVNGLELARVIRQEATFLSTPIVFLSAETDPAQQQRAIMDGAFDFLTKPVVPEYLLRIVRARVAQMRQVDHNIRYLGRLDPATGLFTRSFFERALEAASQRQRQSNNDAKASPALIMLLLDQAAAVEALAPEQRDTLITRVANQVKHPLHHDDIACYLGTGSFVVLASPLPERNLAEFARVLLATVAVTRLRVGSTNLALTASVGIVRVADQATATLLAEARGLAKLAQRDGGNAVQLDTGLGGQDATKAAEDEMHSVLHDAVRHNGFDLVYQPIASLAGDGRRRYEAMLHLQSQPEGQPLTDELAHIARRSGLIKALDRMLLVSARKALAATASQDGTQLYVTISGESLAEEDFLHWLEQGFKADREYASRFCVTIAENDVASSTHAASALRQLTETYPAKKF